MLKLDLSPFFKNKDSIQILKSIVVDLKLVCMLSKLGYMQCIEATWENGVENSNFIDSDSCFHGLILKLHHFW